MSLLLKVVRGADLSNRPFRRFAALGIVCAALSPMLVSTKEPSLTAIELYDGASGAQYVQLSDVLINGKVELRNCDSALSGPMDKSQFGKLPKLTMGSGGVLKRRHGRCVAIQQWKWTGKLCCSRKRKVRAQRVFYCGDDGADGRADGTPRHGRLNSRGCAAVE